MTISTEHRSRNVPTVKLPSRNYIEECQERPYLSRKEKLTIQENTRPHGTRKSGNNYQKECLTGPRAEVNGDKTPRDSELRPTSRTPLRQQGGLAGIRQKPDNNEYSRNGAR